MRGGKLVRDKIPNIIAAETGKSVAVKILTDEEYMDALHDKLDEEVAEFHDGSDIDELVDIYEVLDALVKHLGHTFDDIRTKSLSKRNKCGTFSNRFFLVEEDVDD